MVAFACFFSAVISIASASIGSHGSEYHEDLGKVSMYSGSGWVVKHWPQLHASHVIYEDHHWHYATELTVANVDAYIAKNVDANKTVFVRFVNEQEDPDCVTQAPCWNDMIRNFMGNEDVAFADVLYSKDKIDTIHGVEQYVGNGGWPTVRHFNKDTGYGGRAYKRQTKEPLCDELGLKNLAQWDFLRRYMEEAGDTFLCVSDWHFMNMADPKYGTPNTGCEQWQRIYIDAFIRRQHSGPEGYEADLKRELKDLLKKLASDKHIMEAGDEHRNEKDPGGRRHSKGPHHVLGHAPWYSDMQMLRQKVKIMEEMIRKTSEMEHRRHEHDDWWDPATPNNARHKEL